MAQNYYSGIDQDFRSSSSASNQAFSRMEEAMRTSRLPIQISEREEISANGVRGIWANRAEVMNWRGPIPIDQYQISNDSSPEVLNKRQEDCVTDKQVITYKYLKPPAPPKAGDLIIKQESDSQGPAGPPLVIRVVPEQPKAPEPVVLREEPPRAPKEIPQQTITIPGKQLPPPPRKLIVEKLPVMPTPPPQVIVERWLGYPERTRNVIFQPGSKINPAQAPRNLIIQWETPCQTIEKEVKFAGIVNADPNEYRSRYGQTLIRSDQLPSFVKEFTIPQGEILGQNYNADQLPRLVGDVQALRFIDLERHGLTGYRGQINGGSYSSANSSSNDDNLYRLVDRLVDNVTRNQ